MWGELSKYKWTFVWYQALGGQINDELFARQKELAEMGNDTLTEEALVWAMLGVDEEVA